MIFLKLAQRMTHNSLKSNIHLNKLMCRRSLSEMITYKHENYTILMKDHTKARKIDMLFVLGMFYCT